MYHDYWWCVNLGEKLLSDWWMLFTYFPRQHKIRQAFDPSPLCWICTSGGWRIHSKKFKSLNHCEKDLSCWQQTAPNNAKQNFGFRPTQTQGLWSWTSGCKVKHYFISESITRVIVPLMPPSPKAESFLRAQESLGPFSGSDRSLIAEDMAD